MNLWSVLTGRFAWVVLLALSLIPVLIVLLYIVNFRLSVPYGDEWRQDTPIALAAVDGQWNNSYLFTADDGHRSVFTNVTIALSAAYTQWALKTETAISFSLVIAQFVLLVCLFRQSVRDRSFWFVAIFLFSMLIFTLHRTTSWLSFRHSHYNFAALFVLLALWISGQWPGRWRAFIGVLVCGICASFAFSLGLLVWPIMAVILAARGFGRARLTVWIVAAVVVCIVYFTNSGIGVGQAVQIDPSMSTQVSKSTAIQISLSGTMAERIAAMIAMPILGDYAPAPLYDVAVLAALALGTINLFLIVRSDRSWKAVWSWLAVTGYGLGGAILIGVGRFDNSRLGIVFSEQYVSVATWLWIGFAILTLMSLTRLQATRRGGFLTAFNVVALIAVAALYQLVSLNTIPSIELDWGRPFRLAVDTRLKPEEQCVLDYRFTRDNTCLDRVQVRRGNFEMLDWLAAYRLTIFGQQQPTRVLPDSYTPDDAVMITTGSPWENAHIRDWLLAGVPDDHLYNVLPKRRIDAAFKLNTPRPLGNIAALPGAIIPPEKQTIWLIYPAAQEDQTAGDLLKQLREAGYARISTGTLPAPVSLVVSGYRRE